VAASYCRDPDVYCYLALLGSDVVARTPCYFCQAAADRLGFVFSCPDPFNLCLDGSPKVMHFFNRVLGKPRCTRMSAVAYVNSESNGKPALVGHRDVFYSRRLTKNCIVNAQLALYQLLYACGVAFLVDYASENHGATLLWKL